MPGNNRQRSAFGTSIFQVTEVGMFFFVLQHVAVASARRNRAVRQHLDGLAERRADLPAAALLAPGLTSDAF